MPDRTNTWAATLPELEGLEGAARTRVLARIAEQTLEVYRKVSG